MICNPSARGDTIFGMTKRKPITDTIIGVALGLFSAVVYVLTTAPGVYPGRSAYYAASAAGLMPRWSASFPLYNAVGRSIAWLPGGSLALRFGIFSAVCGGLAIWLFYYLVSTVIDSLVHSEGEDRPGGVMAARLAGMSSALFLAFCIPFWIVSNRAHMASFHVLLLLGAAWLFLRYSMHGGRGVLLLLGLLYGLGTVEFATFDVFAPLFFPALALLMWRRDDLRQKPFLQLVLAVVAGLLLYLAAAWAFYGSVGCHARGYRSFWDIIWHMWRDHYLRITSSLPRVGWLIVLFVGIAPWLASLPIARRALNDERDWTFYGLHVLLTVIGIGVLLNHELAPWPLAGADHLLVTPYVLTAAVFGYLTAYWFLVPGTWWQDSEGRVGQWLKSRLGGFLVVPMLVVVAYAGIRNLPEADARPAAFVSAYTGKVIDGLEGRTWLVTDGSLESELSIAARDRGVDVSIIGVLGSNNEVYRNYVASLFDEPRLKNLAHVGVLPLLQEWVTSRDDVADTTAVLWPPDIWFAAGLSVLPNGLISLGTREASGINIRTVMEQHESLWMDFLPLLAEAGTANAGLATYAQAMSRQISMTANNLGVLMEDLGANEEAARAYVWAGKIDRGNVSALLNLRTLFKKGLVRGDLSRLQERTKRLLEERGGSKRLWSLSRYHGYVRAPEAYADMGMTWALSGRPGLAVSGLRKAMDMLPEERRGDVARTLADVYLKEGQYEESETLYREGIASDPRDVRSLLGLVRVAAAKGDLAGAESYLEKAKEAGLSGAALSMESVFLYLTSGRLDQARILLEELVEIRPEMLIAWDVLADVLSAHDDEAGLAKIVDQLSRMTFARTSYDYAAARLAAIQLDTSSARVHAEQVLRARPRNRRIMEFLLQLDVNDERWRDAAERARQLLLVDGENSMAMFVIGSLHLRSGEHILAEDFLRRSLARAERPEALNNLAWLLMERGKLDEALVMARRAVEMQDSAANLDTLGVILARTGALDEAEELLDRALAAAEGELAIMVHVADVRALKGDARGARELLAVLEERRRELPETEQEQLDEIARLVRSLERK